MYFILRLTPPYAYFFRLQLTCLPTNLTFNNQILKGVSIYRLKLQSKLLSFYCDSYLWWYGWLGSTEQSDRLWVAPDAFHNSDEYDTPKCHPQTRVSVLKDMSWVDESDSERGDLWTSWCRKVSDRQTHRRGLQPKKGYLPLALPSLKRQSLETLKIVLSQPSLINWRSPYPKHAPILKMPLTRIQVHIFKKKYPNSDSYPY